MSPAKTKSKEVTTAEDKPKSVATGAFQAIGKTMTLKPRMSEKTYALYGAENTFVFIVPSSANKLTVAQAVASQFGVTVEKVRIANEKGKTKQSYQKRNRPIAGKRSDKKKAYVRLKAGDSIPIFAAIEEEEKKAKKAEEKAAKKKGAK
jgi:large subunit ribosomal protein L23